MERTEGWDKAIRRLPQSRWRGRSQSRAHSPFLREPTVIIKWWIFEGMYWLFNHYEADIFHCWWTCSNLCKQKQSKQIYYLQCQRRAHYCYYFPQHTHTDLLCYVDDSHTQAKPQATQLTLLWLTWDGDCLYGVSTSLKPDQLNFACSYRIVCSGSSCEYSPEATQEITLAYQLRSRGLRLPRPWEDRSC